MSRGDWWNDSPATLAREHGEPTTGDLIDAARDRGDYADVAALLEDGAGLRFSALTADEAVDLRPYLAERGLGLVEQGTWGWLVVEMDEMEAA